MSICRPRAHNTRGRGRSQRWIREKDCAVLRAGLKMAIIEDFPSDSELGHVAKVRVFFAGTSAVGYAILIKGIND